ncbi:MAG TPA: TadE family protein [Glaciibacter sp.]|nr:TadE family protein [Glaciibacter sp.]
MMGRQRRNPSGQTLVELALVMPLFVMVLMGVIIIGMGVFYQQQLTNAAREAARFASIHSATARCPTVGHLEPHNTMLPSSGSYDRCDPVELRWPKMTPHARAEVHGVDRGNVHFAACWSGYNLKDPTTGLLIPDAHDAPPPAPPPGYDVIGPIDSVWVPCTMGYGPAVDPTVDPNSIPCGPNIPTSDTASSISEGPGRIVANQVTVLACYIWRPPLAGFLLIPSEVHLRAVVSEPIERQQ